MRFNAEVKLDLHIKEVNEQVLKATKEALKDCVVDVAKESKENSPKLTGNNMRSINWELGPGGEIAKDDLEAATYSTSGYGGFL